MNRRDFITSAAAGLGAAATLPMLSPTARAQSVTSRKLFDYAICVDTIWHEEPFLDRLAKVAEAGFRHFDFWRFKDKNIDELARACRQHNLTPVQFVAGWSMNSAERRTQFIADLKEAVVAADKLGVQLMTVIAGFEIQGVSRKDQIGDVVTSLREAEEIARKAGVTLMIEGVNVKVDHPGQIVVTAEQAADIVQTVGSPHVRLLFDVYHQQISAGDLSGNIDRFKELTAYYQIADHPGRHEPGTGEINFANVLRKISEIGYRGPIGLEFKPKESVEKALRAVLAADAAAST